MDAKFVGRWVASGNNMTTGYPGSSFTFKVSGSHNVTIVTSGASRVAYKIDDGSYVKSTSATVSITGLTLSTHTIKVVLTYTSLNNTWAGTNYATVSSITVDQGGEIVTANPAKRRIAIFGDSITEGYMYVNSEGASKSASELTYWNKLGDMLGTDMIPCGIGGIGYVNSLTYTSFPPLSTNPSYIENINSSLVNTDTNFDVILILLGVNDGKSKTEVDNDYVTAVTGCITRIKEKYPSADIHALIPFNNNGKPSLEQVYNAQGVHIIPQTWYSQITFGDSFHPNDNGHTIIANNLKSYFENYYGSAYFKEVTMKRIDTVYIDTNGTVQKVTGTMANNPVKPTLPSGAIKIADVVVEQGASTGTIIDNRQNISSTMSLQTEVDGIKSTILSESTESVFMAAARDDYTSPRLYRFYLSFNGRDFYNYASIPCPSDSAYDSSCLKYINGWFYITFTENTLISKDGINWKQINRALASVMDITWAWAPCLFCDDDGVIHAYSSLKDSNGHFTIIHYKVTQNIDTGELTYVPNSLKYCNNIRENINVTDVIDPAMIKMNGAYIFGCKTEAPSIGMTVWNVSSPDLEDATLTRRFHKNWEGPEALQFVANENSILVYFQNYVQMSVYGECMFKLSVNAAGVVTGGPYIYSRINANGTGVRHMGVTKIPFAIARNIINNCNIYGYGMDPHYKIGSAVSFETTTDSYRRLPNYPEVTYVITRSGATGIYKIAPQAITTSDFVLYNFHTSDVTVRFPTNADADLPSWIQNYEITLPAYSKMVMPYINGVFYTPIVTKCTTIRQLT